MDSQSFCTEIQKTLGGAKAPDVLLNQLLSIANSYVSSSVGFIFLHDADAGSLIFHAGYNCGLEDLERSVLSVVDSASGQVITDKAIAEFENIQEDNYYICKEFARRQGLNRYIAVPLLDADYSVLGVIGLHPSGREPLSETERDDLMGVSRIIALSLDALRRKQREAQVHRSATLGNMLTNRGGLRTIAVALDQVRRSVEAEQVYFFEPGKSETVHVAGAEMEKVGQAFVWELAQKSSATKLPVIEKTDLGVQIFLTASPLSINEKPEGVLVFVNTFPAMDVSDLPFPSKDSQLVALVSNLFEVFLENLRYLDSLKAEEDRRHALTLSLSHEFLIPINGLVSRTDRLKKACSPFFSDRDRSLPPFVYFEDIRRALDDLQELTTGILSLTEETCHFRPCHVFGAIFLRVRDLLKHQAIRRGMEILFDHKEFAESFPPRLMVDKTLVTHVMYNVLKNAIKYGYRDTPIKVRAWNSGRYRNISIENWGIGVPANETELIFEPFRQGSNAHATDVRGAGIGLHISRRIMQLHEGDIVIEKLRDPTIFTIQFHS